MLISAETGERGCDRCHAPIMVIVESPAGAVELCWSCACQFMGVDSTWLEERHTPLDDHILAAFQRSIPADRADTRKWLKGN